ncbi:MAG TPA: flagellar basal body rod protein FlgC [Solirubrobacteraceae bacterium]|jgi:flagellar basal-body rod protein FlgC|nr:flagellar basal body rod protein FlgC [Solirubrobacteraceae bacterium]
MGLFDAIEIAGSGLTAERVRMDVTSENLANAQTTRTASGQPYQRQEVLLQQTGHPSDFESTLAGAMGTGGAAGAGGAPGQLPAGGVKVAGIVADSTPDQLVYNPGNPEANAQGYVKMPNVNTVTEMVDLISESRSYQSDVTAMQTAKSMFTATLGVLK